VERPSRWRSVRTTWSGARRATAGTGGWAGLSLFTFGTLSVGLWGAFTHRIQVHRNFMTGSYFGLVGALIGAVVVPQRRIPQWFLHDPVGLAAGALISLAVAGAIIKFGPGARDGADREAGSGRPAARPARR
jgi:hypothetical protein